jgi:hypothetical protein
MVNFENFYSSVDGTGPAVVHIGTKGQMTDDVKLKICGYRLLVAVIGEPSDSLLLECFRQGLAMKMIHPNMRCLVDLTRFFGVVNWGTLSQLRSLAPWGEDPVHPSRTAYLLRDSSAAMMVKVASSLFPKSQHRAFTGRFEATQWLESGTSATPPA